MLTLCFITLCFLSRVIADLPISGDSLALWECGGVQPERQVFLYTTSSGPLQFHFTVNGTQSNNPIVWDISGPSNNTATPLHIWGSYPGLYPSQQWLYSNVTKQITSVYNAMCVGVDSINGANFGSSIGIYPCNTSDPLQLWSMDANTGSVTLISSATPSLCIQAGNNTPSCDTIPFSTYPYCNPALPISSRLTDLLSRMSASDLARAMDSSIPAIPRLGIPSMGSGEALHGAATGCLSDPSSNSTGCPTSFPCPMALGASFDSTLWENVGLAIGMESRALYNAGAGAIWLFAPNINPCRESRWGRCQEVPSEDSTVVSSYAMHFISGLQGKGGPDPTHLLAASTAKHFISYDLEGYIPRTDPLPRPPTGTCDTSGGCQRWNFDASPRPEDLSGYYAPPFQAAVSVGVRSIMCAYNAVYGQPACASDLLQSILRSNSSSTSWDGHVVSDATAIELMGDSKWDDCKPPYPPLSCTPEPFNSHNYTHTVGETALAALNAGVDVNLGPFFHQWLEALVENGTVPLSALETSVTRIYTTAIKLGLLDPKAGQIYPNLPPSTVDSLEHRQLALLAAQESIVLLSNPQSLLPLKDTLKFAFIGPHANSTQAFLSNYHGDNHLVNSHSPLQVAQSRGFDVTYSLGCNICDVIPPGFPNMPCTKATDTSGIAAAALVAAAADVAILFLGADQTSEAENFDRNDIGLLGVQEQLAQAVIASQPKTIVVLISGGIICSPWIVENAPALLYSFYPGELGGDALVDVITGVYNPGGKLPVTMYYPNITTTRDIRDMDLSSGEGITHSYYKGPVLYPFGSGISYTSWEFKLMTMDMKTKVKTKMTKEENEQVLIVTSEELSRQSLLSSSSAVKVRNAGSRKGDCVLFAFIEREDEEENEGAAKGPYKSLFGFQRLRNIQPGEERDVEFFIQDAMRAGSALARFNSELQTWEPRKGDYRIHIGDISQDAAIRYLRVV